VPSIEKMAEWYEKVLGWKASYDVFDEDDNCTYGGFGTGETWLFNVSRDPGMREKAYERSEMCLFTKVENVDQASRQVSKSGYKLDSPPKDEPWGGRTFSIKDLNGLPLVFYQLNEDH